MGHLGAVEVILKQKMVTLDLQTHFIDPWKLSLEPGSEASPGSQRLFLEPWVVTQDQWISETFPEAA